MVKAGVRILFKSFRLAWRAQRRFWAFIVIYGFLIGMVTYLLLSASAISFLLAVLGGIVVATLYGFILVTFRKNEIATMKCIGWSNGNIRILIIGEILLISVLAFLLFLEIGIHLSGLAFYITGDPTQTVLPIPDYVLQIFIARDKLPITFVTVVLAQIPGILLAYYRILNVKPMEALRMP